MVNHVNKDFTITNYGDDLSSTSTDILLGAVIRETKSIT